MSFEDYYMLAQLTTRQRFELMFGHKITPTYPMPLTREHRQDIHRQVLNYWNATPAGSLLDLADFAMELYERYHSPSQLERTNHALQLEIDRLKAELAAVRFWVEQPKHALLLEVDRLKERIAFLESNSQPNQILTVSPQGGFTVENVWDKPTQPNQP